MNGRYLLDTNAVIGLLKGEEEIVSLLEDADWVGISIISYLEFLSFSELSTQDEKLFFVLAERIEIIGLEMSMPELLTQILEMRKNYKLKLPDSIIAATTINQKASLISADKAFFKIDTLNFIPT